jgi:hypothetical protein
VKLVDDACLIAGVHQPTIHVAQHLIVMALKPSYSYGALRSGLASCNASIRMIKC